MLLVNTQVAAAGLELPGTLVLFCDPERLGDAVYRDRIAARCGEQAPVFAPLDLIERYKGDSNGLSGLKAHLGARLASVPLNSSELEDDSAGVMAVLIAREGVQAADDAEFNAQLTEMSEAKKYRGHDGGANEESALPALGVEEARAKFPPLTTAKLAAILGQTIKRDEINKIVTFLCHLSAFTESEQLNTSFNAPSSTGKSYIPLETSSLFPEEDVIIVSYCSPTAFFHDAGKFDEKIGGYLVDLSRKILIFLDQPHTLLLQHLRPLLSHDKKELVLKITDKSQKRGLRTKNIILRGFPAVIFCTAGLNIDEQEATRFLLLSPETSQEKIREAIHQVISKGADPDAYKKALNADPDRQILKERIRAIRNERIREIRISEPEQLAKRFFSKNRVLKPRHSRDIRRILALIKSFALLNLWYRDREGDTLIANQEDIDQAFNVWNEISESQELNLPPYVYELFKDVILTVYQEKEHGLTRREITKKHFEIHERVLEDWKLRKEILPMLETVGLIIQEPDPADKRKVLVYPTTHSPISPGEKYRGTQGGVTLKTNPDSPELTDAEQPTLAFGEKAN